METLNAGAQTQDIDMKVFLRGLIGQLVQLEKQDAYYIDDIEPFETVSRNKFDTEIEDIDENGKTVVDENGRPVMIKVKLPNAPMVVHIDNERVNTFFSIFAKLVLSGDIFWDKTAKKMAVSKKAASKSNIDGFVKLLPTNGGNKFLVAPEMV